ncbi:SPOR domain-containing protein [Arcticibacter sp. MXS-1]|uniref:HU domain-containing protein n=1 Tax=Arcticibacter sp. MXS-1 TaxID=3341726 RepID=UPI0035A91D2C
MDIALYISELLRDHNEISLSGIGTFSKRRISARYDRESGIFYPPAEEIIFKTGDNGGNELVRYVSTVKKISDASARYFINKFSEHVTQMLESEKKADLSPVGTLQSNSGHIYMLPTTVPASKYGLSPIKDPAFNAASRRVNEQAALAAAYTKDTPVPDFEPAPEKSSRSMWQAVAMISALILLAASLTYVFYPEVFNLAADRPLMVNEKPQPVQRIASLDDQHKDSTGVKDTLHEEVSAGTTASRPADTVQKRVAPAPVKEAAAATSQRPAAAPRFEVIGASLALRSEAENYLKVMKSRGIKASIYEDTRKPRYKISLGSYQTYEEANQEKRKVQNSFNKEAWILTVKE